MMKSVGIRQVFIVIGYLGYEIVRALGNGSEFGIQIEYIEQTETLGIAHAVGRLEGKGGGRSLVLNAYVDTVPVERPETLSMLRQDANQLQRALDNAGLSTGNSGLQFSLRDQSSQGQNDGGGSNPNAHRLIVAEEDTIPAAFAGRSHGRMLGSSGGVDIRV
jgi:hypothetical protein